MSSLAAARADNFYYPPEWTPKKGSLNKFHGQHCLLSSGFLKQVSWSACFEGESKKNRPGHLDYKIWSFTMKSACCKHEIVIQTDPKNCEYVIISGATRKTEEYDVEDAETWVLPVDEDRSKLADPFYRLEHQEEDLKKKKEADPVLVRLQRMSDARHSDDYALNKALRTKLRVCYLANVCSLSSSLFPLPSSLFRDIPLFAFIFPLPSQKKRVAEEEAASRKIGLGIRLLPPSEEDTAAAARVRFSSKFDRNRKEKRALINAASIFPGSSGSSKSHTLRLELESKRRKINAATASKLLVGGFKPSSWSRTAVSSAGRNRI